jgi:hypothetical protein
VFLNTGVSRISVDILKSRVGGRLDVDTLLTCYQQLDKETLLTVTGEE